MQIVLVKLWLFYNLAFYIIMVYKQPFWKQFLCNSWYIGYLEQCRIMISWQEKQLWILGKIFNFVLYLPYNNFFNQCPSLFCFSNYQNKFSPLIIQNIQINCAQILFPEVQVYRIFTMSSWYILKYIFLKGPSGNLSVESYCRTSVGHQDDWNTNSIKGNEGNDLLKMT